MACKLLKNNKLPLTLLNLLPSILEIKRSPHSGVAHT
jgi:hypothetical protein